MIVYTCDYTIIVNNDGTSNTVKEIFSFMY